MDLCKEIIISILKDEDLEISFPNLEYEISKAVELRCYKALKEIKSILADDTLEDETCFERIEKIVCLFEEMGSTCGGRHDFG